MKNFKQLLKEFRMYPDRGRGDDDHDKYMRQLMLEMRKHPFEYTTSEGHQVQWHNSLDAMHNISFNLAKHDNAYGEHAVRHGEDSPQAMYHSDAGDKHSELYEALRTHIENHPKIHPTLRTYTQKVFEVAQDVHDRKWSDEDNQQKLLAWSNGLRQNKRHNLDDIHQMFKENPDMGYFIHKDEME